MAFKGTQQASWRRKVVPQELKTVIDKFNHILKHLRSPFKMVYRVDI